MPRVVQAPFIALGVASLCGMGNFFNSAAADMVNRDEKRDDTKYVDSLFQVQSPNELGLPGVPTVGKTTTIENGRIQHSSELGSDDASAERNLNKYVTPAAAESGAPPAQPMNSKDVISKVSQDPPTSITMDFLSAASKVWRYSAFSGPCLCCRSVSDTVVASLPPCVARLWGPACGQQRRLCV